MGETFLIFNGTRIPARLGDTVLAAGEAAGLRLPKDGAGPCAHEALCESCRIRIESGDVDDAGSRIGASVLACRAKVTGEAGFSFQPFPREMKTSAEVIELRSLAPEIVELVVRIEKPIPYLPGQHVLLSVGKWPARRLTPTLSLDGLRELDTLHFHIRRRADGVLGGNPERLLVPGTRLKLSGPYGQSFLRPGDGRIVLVSSGTGFAAIWSMAVAARLGQPHRPLHVVASAHDPRQLYMRPAVEWLARQGVSDITLTASGAHPLPPARGGRAIQHLPGFSPSDTIYAAGHPEMVRAVMLATAQARATAYGIPHVPAAPETGMVEKIARFFGRGPKRTEPVATPEPEALAGNVRRIRPI
jgi:3-phenylpropionate/trans-cinnamate dioxygenase ferredoxin reductase subunit